MFFQTSFGTNYYISNAGSDGNNGLTPATSWQTTGKINGASFNAGDSILFKRGDTFYGHIIIKNNGSIGKAIIFSSFGTGANPVISGFTKVNSWTSLGSNLWESTSAVSANSRISLVSINGGLVAMGRYPNSGWRTVGSSTGNSITDPTLDATNWSGAELVTRKTQWVIDRDLITSQSGTTINFTASSFYSPTNGYGYFIQNDIRTLDSQNEWYYNTTTKKISVYSTTQPINVSVSSVDTLISMLYKSDISISGIDFTGAGKGSISMGSCAKVKITNCTFNLNYSGIISNDWGGSSDSIILRSCTFSNIQNDGVFLSSEFTNGIIDSNLFKNVGLIPGMSGSGDNSATSFASQAQNGSSISYNKVDSCGYIGIFFSGSNTTVNNNYVNNTCFIKGDGAGIYFKTEPSFSDTNVKVRNNIVRNTTGNLSGTTSTYPSAHGIYLDDYATNVELYGNTVYKSGAGGLFIHNGSHINVHNNIFFDNYDSQLLFQNDNGMPSLTGSSFFNNQFIARLSNQLCLNYISNNAVTAWGSMDSNYYARPINDSLVFSGTINNAGSYQKNNLTGWQSYSGFDLNSKKSPKIITDTSYLRFEYNATTSNKTIALDQPYIDVVGNGYSNSLTLAPFTSIVLIKGTQKFTKYAGKFLKTANGKLINIIK